jgi:hypothetical protein
VFTIGAEGSVELAEVWRSVQQSRAAPYDVI